MVCRSHGANNAVGALHKFRRYSRRVGNFFLVLSFLATATHLLPPPFFLIFFFRLLGRVTLLLLRLLVEDIFAFEEG
jgi:hypothetical protein